MEYCVQGSDWLLYITEDIFLGPDGFLGMLAPKRYVHDGCHGHSSKFSLVSLCSHHGHTLAHTIAHISNDTTLPSPAGFILGG